MPGPNRPVGMVICQLPEQRLVLESQSFLQVLEARPVIDRGRHQVWSLSLVPYGYEHPAADAAVVGVTNLGTELEPHWDVRILWRDRLWERVSSSKLKTLERLEELAKTMARR